MRVLTFFLKMSTARLEACSAKEFTKVGRYEQVAGQGKGMKVREW